MLILISLAVVGIRHLVQGQQLFFEGFDEVMVSTGTGPITGVSDEGVPWSATSAGPVEDGFGSENNRFFGTDTDFEVTWTTDLIDVSEYAQVVLTIDFSDEGSDLECGCNIPNLPNNNQLNIADVDYFDVFFSYDDQNYNKIATPFGCSAGCPNTMNPGERTIFSDCIPPFSVDDIDFQDYAFSSYIDVSGQDEIYIRIVLYNSSNSETTSFTNVSLNGTILPVELRDFWARAFGEGKVLLEWSTDTELNNDRFEVERSLNGLDYDKVATLAGAGTSTVKQHYRWIDTPPVPGLMYYRLRQVDGDGTFSYSEVRQVTLDAGFESWAVAPVPASGQVTLISGRGMGRAEVFDVLGRLRFQCEVSHSGHTPIPISNLESGRYLLRYAGSVKWLVVK